MRDRQLGRIHIRILINKLRILQTDRTSKLEETLNHFMQMSMENQKNTDASIKNLETQVGQIVKQLAEQQGGTFITNTQTNPKEHCK